MRFFFIFLLTLVLFFLFLQGRTIERSSEKPIFLKIDEIALAHDSDIHIIVDSKFKPDTLQLETIKKDYNNIWAHLNNLYNTNDIISGKEYFTEKWFRQHANHYDGTVESFIKRQDKYHELHIKNWSSDGLICTAIDSNVIFTYTDYNLKVDTTVANFAVLLLYQGDNWRIDALKVLD